MRKPGRGRRPHGTVGHRPSHSPYHPVPVCWPYRWFAGLNPVLLGLLKFAGLTAQANVNKPSKPTPRPANRHQGQRTDIKASEPTTFSQVPYQCAHAPVRDAGAHGPVRGEIGIPGQVEQFPCRRGLRPGPAGPPGPRRGLQRGAPRLQEPPVAGDDVQSQVEHPLGGQVPRVIHGRHSAGPRRRAGFDFLALLFLGFDPTRGQRVLECLRPPHRLGIRDRRPRQDIGGIQQQIPRRRVPLEARQCLRALSQAAEQGQ